MSTVGSLLKADAVDQQLLVAASGIAVRPASAAPEALSQDETSISPAGRLRSATQAVRDEVDSLAQAQVWQAQRVVSSAPQQVQASGSGAGVGSREVKVQALASAQVTSTPAFSSLSTVVGIGTLSIEMGKWSSSSSTFATNPNWPKASVSLGDRDNTLERVRDRINAAGVGVVAAVVSDATGSRLVLSAASTGADNGFRIQADPADVGAPAAAGNALAQFGFDPASVAGAGQGMQLVQAAQDAQLTLDGRALSSASNVVDDAESGLRLNLQATTPSAVRLDVQADDELIQRRLQALAAGSQDLMSQARQPDRPDDPGTRQARQAANEALDTLRSSLNGPDAATWQDLGLSWDEQAGVRQQAVSWTDERRQQAQAMFAALQQRWPDATAEAPALPPTPHARPDATPDAPPAATAVTAEATSTSPAVVQRNRQRLQEQYDAAPGDLARQDLAVS